MKRCLREALIAAARDHAQRAAGVNRMDVERPKRRVCRGQCAPCQETNAAWQADRRRADPLRSRPASPAILPIRAGIHMLRWLSLLVAGASSTLESKRRWKRRVQRPENRSNVKRWPALERLCLSRRHRLHHPDGRTSNRSGRDDAWQCGDRDESGRR